MSKIILLDLDGIVIRPRHKYFSVRYSEDHGVPLKDILPFFKGEYKKAARGETTIKEVLPAYLSKWRWKGSVEEFLNYWFDSERTLDENVLGVVRDLRNMGNKIYLVSDNEVERGKYIMEKLGLKNEFDGGFFSFDLGYTKGEPEFFQKVLNKLNLKPQDLEYWDDDPKNVEVAKEVGINAKVYNSYEEFKEKLSSNYLQRNL